MNESRVGPIRQAISNAMGIGLAIFIAYLGSTEIKKAPGRIIERVIGMVED